ncbi:hypothetical protein ACFQ2B_34515 [Streptomyces stramineus]
MQRSQLAVVAHFLRDVILTKTDRGGMRSALELRSPSSTWTSSSTATRCPPR